MKNIVLEFLNSAAQHFKFTFFFFHLEIQEIQKVFNKGNCIVLYFTLYFRYSTVSQHNLD